MPNDHGSRARFTNGSYIVPIGNSGCPSRDHVAPSSPSSPTRLPSAIPSSMCWPCSDCRQRTSVSLSSANQSMRSPRFQTPARLIQPPRFVDDATSGLTVTTCRVTSGAVCARSTKNRPNACCVDAAPWWSRPTSTGTAGAGRTFTSGRRRRAAVSRQNASSAEPSPNRSQGLAGSTPNRPASCSHCSVVSSAEWLAGCPSVGRFQALIVYAKTTDGRSVTRSAARNASSRSARS